MEVTATFAEGTPLTVLVDAYNLQAIVETFFEMGAITVCIEEE